MRRNFTFCVLFCIFCMSTSLFAEISNFKIQDVSWQMTVNNIDPVPQPSGFQIAYRFQLQAAALSENEALNTEVRFPAQDPTYFTLPTAHPSIESFSFDGATNEWVIDFQDVIYAGTSIEFDIIAHSPNHTTANGTTFDIDATVISDNATSVSALASGEWSATANLGVKKYLQFGPDSDALLDIPVKYYLYPCDPSYTPGALGHLYLENWTLVDELPIGVVYNASSGTYDSGNHSVTWSDAAYIENEDCDFSGETNYWVEVTFPSSIFGAAAVPPVLEATNTATFEGYPIGESTIPANLLSDSDALLHGFGLPNPVGSHTKSAYTPYFGTQTITHEGDGASFHIAIRTSSASSLPYYFKIVDALPCLTNTPNVATQYESPELTDPVCSEMAFQPTDYIQLSLAYNYLLLGNPTNFAIQNPTIPLDLVTTNGDTLTINVPFQQDYFNQLQYQVLWADIQSFIGVGVGVSSVIWDSETIGVQVGLTTLNNRQAARLSLSGSVAEDTPTYPMLAQYRVRNYGHFYMKALGQETYIGAVQDDVTIFNRGPVANISKTISEETGLVTISVNSESEPFRSDDSLIITDLLPLGYTFGEEAQQFVSFQEGNWYWSSSQGNTNSSEFSELNELSVRNYIDVEVIDNYNGTGRQLVRATFLTPPLANHWDDMSSFRFSFYLEQTTMNYAGVNTGQIFPTNPISAADLLIRYGISGYPSAPNSNDVNDLDGDGITTGDSYGENDADIIPTNTIVDIRSYQAVRGDLATAEFVPFPAIAGITDQGGIADFQINLSNIGGIGLENLVIYDILPHIGDTGLTETQVGSPRGSAFDVTFTGIDMSTLPTGAVVEYSVSTNPCRNELTTGATPFPTGCTDDWTSTVPANIGDVKALRITFPTGDISEFIPGESLSIEYGVTYPVGVQPGDVAWNNFAYAATRMDDFSSILPTEAPKVGIAIPQIDLAVNKTVSPSTNFLGDASLYTITLDHEGSVTTDGDYTLPAGEATNVTLADNFISQGLTIVSGSASIINSSTNSDDGATFDEANGTITIPTIGPNDTYEITYYAYSNVEASITNTVEVMSHPNVEDQDSTPGNGDNTEDDYDQATATWVNPAIQIQTLVESYSGSGVFIEADASDGLVGTYTSGQPINYQFVITNTGTAHLYNLSLVDSLVGFECNQSLGSLSVGASTTVNCTWPYGFPDIGSQYLNMASIEADAIIGTNTKVVVDVDFAEVLIINCDLMMSSTSTNPTCINNNDGSIDLNTANGAGLYQITWSGTTSGSVSDQNMPYSIPNLASGVYDVTVTDRNGCSDETDASIELQCASIQGNVWYDPDHDGFRSNTEVMVGEVAVTLHLLDGTVANVTTTNSSGYYEFIEIPTGDYYISFDESNNSNGYVFVSGTELEANKDADITDANDSDMEPYTRVTPSFNLPVNGFLPNIDAGFVIVPLPVELLFFVGESNDCINKLTWATATEKNNSHFIVELSTDGFAYEAFAVVEGNGNSTERIDYSYVHENVRKKYNYYRLRQVDFDGTNTITGSLVLESDCKLIKNTGIVVYPNPSINDVVLEIFSEVENEVELMISDVTGKVLEQKTIQLHSGINRNEIDMDNYKYGIYLFSIQMNGTYEMIKVIKAE